MVLVSGSNHLSYTIDSFTAEPILEGSNHILNQYADAAFLKRQATGSCH